ncbi:hypothetical protein [Arachidicoccus ginsenosidimutans]|uniref:hypothetical protein n=1 Tax=Arachidicoccus sp. BS20 TaxID=1850526 RepID=UPI0012E8DFE6|nr:hypothetical protein [Arachidicoccus sp. BS20]
MFFISIIGISRAQKINELGSINIFLNKSRLFKTDSFKSITPFADKFSIIKNQSLRFKNNYRFYDYKPIITDGRNNVAAFFQNRLKQNPSVLSLDVPAPVFLYNNGKGFDVYQSSIDRMSILKPDKTFKSNMPNAKVKSISTGK